MQQTFFAVKISFQDCCFIAHFQIIHSPICLNVPQALPTAAPTPVFVSTESVTVPSLAFSTSFR